jgi:hypothetical protein
MESINDLLLSGKIAEPHDEEGRNERRGDDA